MSLTHYVNKIVDMPDDGGEGRVAIAPSVGAQEGVAADEAQRTLLRRGIVADAVRRGGDGRYEYAAERVAELPAANRQDYGYVRSRLRRADRRSSTAEAAVDDAPTRRQKAAVRAELERLRLIDSRGE